MAISLTAASVAALTPSSDAVIVPLPELRYTRAPSKPSTQDCTVMRGPAALPCVPMTRSYSVWSASSPESMVISPPVTVRFPAAWIASSTVFSVIVPPEIVTVPADSVSSSSGSDLMPSFRR